jgi:hypothetical protein
VALSGGFVSEKKQFTVMCLASTGLRPYLCVILAEYFLNISGSTAKASLTIIKMLVY